MTHLTLEAACNMIDAHGNLSLYDTGITSLPAGLRVGGYLDLSGTGITSLPTTLHVEGGLYLANLGITSLPHGLHVGGRLGLFGTGIPVIYHDTARGYELRAVLVGGVVWYVAGCRTFKSATEALAHWGGAEYPNTARGLEYCNAIKETS